MAAPGSPRNPNIGKVVIDDLRRPHLHRDYMQEIKDVYYFYLDDERRQELAGMGRLRRAFSLLWWLLKSLLMKLKPARRLAVFVALICSVMGWTGFTTAQGRMIGFDMRMWGFAILLVILMLELRDKLLARDEIEVARQVQLALLPDTHPEIPGWTVWSYSRPANDVGGDLVDYLDLGGFRHGVLLGDVAGKGLGAALLTAKLQATLRALVPDAPGLDELGARVNTILHRDGIDNRYATLFFAELEHDSGQLRYLNAGHNPPFVIRATGIERLPASSFPLGMLAHANYDEGAVALESGDVLVAYSDGLTEATGANGEEFGVERLEALLPGCRQHDPETIARRLLAEVDAFIGEVRPGDDLSLLVLRRH